MSQCQMDDGLHARIPDRTDGQGVPALMDKWLLVLAAEIVLAAIIIANLPALLRLH
jgi:hypothetical protein